MSEPEKGRIYNPDAVISIGKTLSCEPGLIETMNDREIKLFAHIARLTSELAAMTQERDNWRSEAFVGADNREYWKARTEKFEADLAEAKKELAEARGIIVEVLDPEHMQTLTSDYVVMAMAQRLKLAEEALERYRKAGPDDPETKEALEWADTAKDPCYSSGTGHYEPGVLAVALRAAYKQMEDWRHTNAGWKEASRLKNELDSAKARIEEQHEKIMSILVACQRYESRHDRDPERRKLWQEVKASFCDIGTEGKKR